MKLSSASPKLPTQPHHMPQDINPEPVPTHLPHISKMGPLHERCNINI